MTVITNALVDNESIIKDGPDKDITSMHRRQSHLHRKQHSWMYRT